MIEAWMPVILAGVIVIGMVTARVWTTLLSEGLHLLREWFVDGRHALDRADRADGALPSRAELARRIEYLEEQVHFLESLLEEPRGTSIPAAHEPLAPSEHAGARGRQAS